MNTVASPDISRAREGHQIHENEMRLSDNAVRVLEARYLKKNEAGEVVETPAEMFHRVAGAVADAERHYSSDPKVRSEWEKRFYNLMVSKRFMPNSPTLMNAGREMGMLSACFVLPVNDSVDDIFDSIKHTALIQKAGGGTGFAFDRLRPTGDYIKSSGGTTSGPISFWKAFSEATNAIQQGAFRRGANMGMMNIHHPDILKFLHAKEDLTEFTNYNISVKITDEWMEAFRAEPDGPHKVVNPRTGRAYYVPRDVDIKGYDIRTLVPIDKAETNGAYYTHRDIWQIVVNNAWRTGEPGILFVDRVNEYNPTPHLGRIEATNPCGEQPLLDYEACNLGSINLSVFVENPGTQDAHVDWDSLGESVDDAIRFLDNVIDVNNYPLPQIDEVCKGNRKIGLGIMGFADALYMLGVGYNSEEGLKWGERFMRFVNDRAHAHSEKLANERGCFPNWKGSIWDTRHQRPMRNAACTTVAPTGTISMIAGCSCGIEPLFNLVFYRNVLRENKDNKPMVEINPIFAEKAQQAGIYSAELMERIAKDATLAKLPEIPAWLKSVFVVAHDISPEWHVRMQAAYQSHCDSSISKTINFPNAAKVSDVESIYQMSYDLRCKGVTVYRDGCRDHQPMSTGKTKSGSAEAEKATNTLEPRVPKPADLLEVHTGLRIRQMTPFGNMHVHITVDTVTGRELEVFAQLGKGGDLANSDLEAICRMVSLWLRSGGHLNHVIRQLQGIGSSLQLQTKDGKIMSLGDGLARALIKYTRVKERFGLNSLVTGDFELPDLSDALAGRDRRQQEGNGDNKKKNGNGNGNGNSKRPNLADIGTDGVIPMRTELRTMPDRFSRINQEEQYKVVCPECGSSSLHFSEGCVHCVSCGYAACQ